MEARTLRKRPRDLRVTEAASVLRIAPMCSLLPDRTYTQILVLSYVAMVRTYNRRCPGLVVTV